MKKSLWLIIFVLGIASCTVSRKQNSAEFKYVAPDITEVKEDPELVLKDDKAAEAPVNYSEQSTWLLGYFAVNRLKSYPHSKFFFEGYDSYTPDESAVAKLKTTDWTGIKIKVVLGTWCPDSRKHVPHFFRVLSQCGYPEDKTELIGVDNTKFSPVENYSDLGIIRVPTFIFYKNNIEIGRIIENPATSLEQDMVNILNRNE